MISIAKLGITHFLDIYSVPPKIIGWIRAVTHPSPLLLTVPFLLVFPPGGTPWTRSSRGRSHHCARSTSISRQTAPAATSASASPWPSWLVWVSAASCFLGGCWGRGDRLGSFWGLQEDDSVILGATDGDWDHSRGYWGRLGSFLGL